MCICIQHNNRNSWLWWIWYFFLHITLDHRLPFTDSVGAIFPGPATTQKVYQGIEGFPQLAGLQWLTVFSMLIRGITAGDWHILLSCSLFWPRVKFRQVFILWIQCDVRTHQNKDSTLKDNCNVMRYMYLCVGILYVLLASLKHTLW